MFLGLDLGTSGLRALLVDEAQNIVGSAEATYPIRHPHPGWSEQDPSDWVKAAQQCLETLKTSCPRHWPALKGIGISGQMHGAVVLDRAGQVLRPAILWNDSRCHEEAAHLDGMPNVRALSGNIVFPGFTAPKLLWLEKHEPEIFQQVAKVLLPKDYLRYWLTGGYVGDKSDAAGTSWLDVGLREWSSDLLDVGHMRRDQMPELVEGCTESGQMRAELRSTLGLHGPVMVVGGGGDNAVAACGAGSLNEGDGFVSLGTSGVLLAARDSFSPMPQTAVHSFCHAVPGRWYQMGVTLAATDSLNWLSRQLGTSAAGLAQALPDHINGPSQALFLPYLSGERTPHNDAIVRGGFLGLDIASEPLDLTRAVMEGVAFALRDSLEALRETGADLTSLLAIGGGTQSAFWVETLATVLNLPLHLPKSGEFGAALGAARLAIVGVTGRAPDEVMQRPEIANVILPQTGLQPRYEGRYQAYRKAYPLLKSVFA